MWLQVSIWKWISFCILNYSNEYDFFYGRKHIYVIEAKVDSINSINVVN